MKKIIVLFFICVFIAGLLPAQQNQANFINTLDNAARTTAESLNRRINELGIRNIGVGQFTYRGALSPLGDYWQSQLTSSLVNISNRQYTVLSGGTGADWVVSGEILVLGDTVRIFTRLVRSVDRTLEASFQSDFDSTSQLQQMLSIGADSSSSSWEFPVILEIGHDENAPVMERVLRPNGEEYFLIVPHTDGRLVVETTGSLDTYMEFFDADNWDYITENDDGGTNYNARIAHSVQAGRRYMAIITGWSSSTSGSFGIRAYLQNADNNWNNPIIYDIGRGDGSNQIFRILGEGDRDHFLLIPGFNGWLTMETTGSTDTFMELYDADSGEMLDSNDDSGSGLNARISYNVQSGRRYIAMVRGYGSWSTGDYGFFAYRD